MQSVKCVLVGDGFVGKTSVLIRFINNDFNADYVPTIFDTYSHQMTVDDRPICLCLWDTAGQEDYDRLRPLSYSDTNVFVICYSVDSQSSYDNVSARWITELRHYRPDSTPILLVATKIDIRRNGDIPCLTPLDGKIMMEKVGLSGFKECSSRTDEGIRDVFVEAVRLVLQKPPQRSRKRKCFIF